MDSESAAISRPEALKGLVAAFAAAPIDGERILAIAAQFARVLPRLDGEPAEASTALRAGISAKLGGEAMRADDSFALRAFHRAMLLMFDLCVLGPAPAMAACLDDAVGLPDGLPIMSSLVQLIEKTALDPGLTKDDLGRLVAHPLWDGRRGPEGIVMGLALLGLSRGALLAVRRQVFFALVPPLLAQAAARDDIDAMLAIERLSYEACIKAVEEPAHHIEGFGVFEAAFDRVPFRQAPPRRTAPGATPRLAFLIPNGLILAHTEVLLSFLAGLKALPDPPIDPVVLIYQAGNGGPLGERLEALGVEWAALGMTSPSGFRAHFDRMRAWIGERNIDGVVFVSLAVRIAYFCRQPLAPAQIWWSMKFALPNFAALDGRVFFRSLFNGVQEIAGRQWRGGPIAISAPALPNPATVQAIRDRFAGQTIIGTVAREEKIANPEFLAGVVTILQRHPEACFLWTGKRRPPEIVRAFEDGGVAERCHFLGWVDPAAHIMAFDLMLETYPLTGLIFGWAMALGKPVIAVGPLGILGSYLEPIMDGSIPVTPAQRQQIDEIFAPLAATTLPGIWAKTPAEMPAFADALLEHPASQAVLGAVQKAYVDTFLADEAASAAAQANHFADIVRESRSKL